MGIPREGMTDVQRIGTIRQKPAPTLISHPEFREGESRLGGEGAKQGKATFTWWITLPPGSADWRA
jgi:hypothetical protein